MSYGLIAGNGKFPFLVAEGARACGEELAVVAIKEETDPRISDVADNVAWVGIELEQKAGPLELVLTGRSPD